MFKWGKNWVQTVFRFLIIVAIVAFCEYFYIPYSKDYFKASIGLVILFALLCAIDDHKPTDRGGYV